MLHIGAHCALPRMLCSNVQEHNEMVDAQSQIGLASNSNLQKKNLALQTFDGDKGNLHLHHLQLEFQVKKHSSSKLQQQIPSQCVQQQPWCMLFQLVLPAPGNRQHAPFDSWALSMGTFNCRRSSVSESRISSCNQSLESWHCRSIQCSRTDGVVLATCHHMQSPENPSYLGNGPPPANHIRELRRETSLENLAALQCYLEKLQFEANTLRMWYNGLQDEIVDEVQKVHLHMMRMVGEFQRVNRAQGRPAQWQATANQPQPPAVPAQVAAPSSKAASATGLPMKGAPSSRPPMLQIRVWPALQGILAFQVSRELTHGHSTSPSDNEHSKNLWASRSVWV